MAIPLLIPKRHVAQMPEGKLSCTISKLGIVGLHILSTKYLEICLSPFLMQNRQIIFKFSSCVFSLGRNAEEGGGRFLGGILILFCNTITITV